ncbi:2-phospho-L-lactate guanylyltransferase [Candidatus Bathyarchaeota archaeon]|nr:MAG: 2-phospho-L-lactate guanylyltransferase [Candidatus Bathyarchaeota archaeon]
MREVAVVPVKSLTEAKKRLAGALSSEDRQSIVIAMLNDVLHSLNRANLFGQVIVVTPDNTLEYEAEKNHSRFVRQVGDGLNAAVRQVTKMVVEEGASALSCVLGDIPLVEPGDFEELHRISRWKPRVVLSPSLKGGTNVLMRSPPEAIPIAYGRWSYAKHLRAAQEGRVPLYSVSNERLSLDIDTVDDLRILRQRDSMGRTNAGRLVKQLSRLREPFKSKTVLAAGAAVFGALAAATTWLVQVPYPVPGFEFLRFDAAEVIDATAFLIFGPEVGFLAALVHWLTLNFLPTALPVYGPLLKFLAVTTMLLGMLVGYWAFTHLLTGRTGMNVGFTLMGVFGLTSRVLILTPVNYLVLVYVFNAPNTAAVVNPYLIGIGIFNAIHAVISMVVPFIVTGALFRASPELKAKAWITGPLRLRSAMRSSIARRNGNKSLPQ